MTARNLILVAGIGQSLRGDDAAGLEAVRYWAEQFPETAAQPSVLVEYLETPGLTLLESLRNVSGAILVDAMQGGGVPLRRLSGQELRCFTSDSRSAHGLGVAEALALGYELYPELGKIPIILIGIEGHTFALGEPLSESVRRLLPHTAQMIQEEVLLLLSGQKAQDAPQKTC
ncbi:MAG: hydrogenase maturation protease [Anaerolineales bacterium]|nr:hydrogenase maturation protease [Anaerolineales bacterium]MCX7609452.1 hydrogenase maturation protease [Anaerolineales bacterium]MDW8227694.1 hydrogenase maturation protease [Anaerolineales bacterium]